MSAAGEREKHFADGVNKRKAGALQWVCLLPGACQESCSRVCGQRVQPPMRNASGGDRYYPALPPFHCRFADLFLFPFCAGVLRGVDLQMGLPSRQEEQLGARVGGETAVMAHLDSSP